MFLLLSTSVAILNALAFVNFVSAFIVLYMMQTVTGAAGFRSKLAILYLVQRGVYILLVYALFENAVHIYFNGVMPVRSDALVETAFFLSCVVSFLRHRLAPSLPVSPIAEQWSKSILRPHY